MKGTTMSIKKMAKRVRRVTFLLNIFEHKQIAFAIGSINKKMEFEFCQQVIDLRFHSYSAKILCEQFPTGFWVSYADFFLSCILFFVNINKQSLSYVWSTLAQTCLHENETKSKTSTSNSMVCMTLLHGGRNIAYISASKKCVVKSDLQCVYTRYFYSQSRLHISVRSVWTRLIAFLAFAPNSSLVMVVWTRLELHLPG